MSAQASTMVEDPWAAVGPRRLSPSRAKDFQQCPRMYRWKTVDRLPDPATWAQARGVLVHAVLERLYGLPADERVEETALGLAPQTWTAVLAEHPEYVERFPEWGLTVDEVHEQARALLSRYFTVEDPTTLGTPSTEQDVHAHIGGVPVRGIIDRVDVAPDGRVRIVDYKTGKAPGPRFRHEALWQLRFYAMLWLSTTGVTPTALRLVYLGGDAPEIVETTVTRADAAAFVQDVQALWAEINHAFDAASFPARTGTLCGWCPFLSLCPEGRAAAAR